MDCKDEWTANDNMGQRLARGRKLGDKAYPTMFDPEDCLLLFMAEGRLYILNSLSWSLNKIRSPTSLGKIILNIKVWGMRGFRWRMIQ